MCVPGVFTVAPVGEGWGRVGEGWGRVAKKSSQRAIVDDVTHPCVPNRCTHAPSLLVVIGDMWRRGSSSASSYIHPHGDPCTSESADGEWCVCVCMCV